MFKKDYVNRFMFNAASKRVLGKIKNVPKRNAKIEYITEYLQV
jgi:hypothetical protein